MGFKRVVPKTKADAEKLDQGPKQKKFSTMKLCTGPFNLPDLKDGIVGSEQQLKIWEAMVWGESHMLVNARAGTGKTFTMIRGLKLMEAAGRLPKYVNMAAFNSAVGNELKSKVPSGVRAGTLHSLGFSACRYAINDVKVDDDKMDVLLTEIMGEKLTKPQREMYHGVLRLASLCKNSLIGRTSEHVTPCWECDYEGMDALCERHSIAFSQPGDAYELVEQLMTAGLEDFDVNQRIDYDDMIWLPVVLGFRVFKSDLLIVDEYQDLNRCQRRLIEMAGKRVMLVGDEHQAIYGFRGADMDNQYAMRLILRPSKPGLEEYALTKTRRCPKSHVAIAQKVVPDFEAFDDAPLGEVREVAYDDLNPMPGDMVVCRTNAPLVALAFQMIRQRKRVKIQGRDIGEGLIKTISAYGEDHDPSDRALQAFDRAAESQRIALEKTKGHGKKQKLLEAFMDRCMIVRFFLRSAPTVGDVKRTIRDLFADTNNDDRTFTLLSSVHKAKGLEAETVVVLGPEKMPHPMAKTVEDKQQEWNCWYVAHTRSKRTMILTPLPEPETF